MRIEDAIAAVRLFMEKTFYTHARWDGELSNPKLLMYLVKGASSVDRTEFRIGSPTYLSWVALELLLEDLAPGRTFDIHM